MNCPRCGAPMDPVNRRYTDTCAACDRALLDMLPPCPSDCRCRGRFVSSDSTDVTTE